MKFLHLQFRNYGLRCECVNAMDISGKLVPEYLGRLFADVCSEFGIYSVDDAITYFLAQTDHYYFKCRLQGGLINLYINARK